MSNKLSCLWFVERASLNVLALKFSFCPLFFLLLSSCKEEAIPSYVSIPSISVTTNSSQGSSSSNITDAWVYFESNLQGVYELPVQFPIIASGNARLIVFAGIKLNGISATRAAYPFYRGDTIDITLEETVADTILPTVTYSSDAIFNFIEDFENGSGFGSIQATTAEIFEGNNSGKLIVADSNEVIALSASDYIIPYNTAATFLEMDYKNNHVFEVGIRVIISASNYDIYKLTVPPRNEWNKLYVNFTPEVRQSQADSYQIYFRTVAQTHTDSVAVFFDNLKLIHAKVQ